MIHKRTTKGRWARCGGGIRPVLKVMRRWGERRSRDGRSWRLSGGPAPWRGERDAGEGRSPALPRPSSGETFIVAVNSRVDGGTALATRLQGAMWDLAEREALASASGRRNPAPDATASGNRT